MTEPIFIVKASGEREPWNRHKLERSLKAAKATPELAGEIVRHIEKDLTDGLRTIDIYAHAFALLKKYHRPTAAEYSLRRALLDLGPSGFPFERFIAKILEAKGYRTRVGVMVQGACVEHEVDVVAEKPERVIGDKEGAVSERILVEAKFHNSLVLKTDVKVALYISARFQDIAKRSERDNDATTRFTQAWLITNTNFTSQAIRYSTCAGLALTGWNYPKGQTLQDLVQETQMHPLTCLTTLSSAHKTTLLKEGFVLCRDIAEEKAPLGRLGINKQRQLMITKEAVALCPISL